MEVLKITNARKKFGDQTVLNGVSMTVESGAIFGFIGKNGAGKTTTMKSILGLLKLDGGEIKVCGETVNYGETKTNKNIGYLPDVPSFYKHMTAMEYLKLCGEIAEMDSNKIKTKSLELLKLVGLDVNKKRISTYSRGMKQRLGIAQALITEPKLLICDEPTSALDPIGRKEILDILLKIKDKTTVIFSTHVLSDVEDICDNIALLHKGKIVVSGNLDDVRKQLQGNSIEVVFNDNGDANALSKLLVECEIECNVDFNKVKVKSENTMLMQKLIIEKLYENKLVPLKLEISNPTLEDLVLEVIR